MPAHGPLQMIFRSAYETGLSWPFDLNYVLLYEAVLIAVYMVVAMLTLTKNQ